MKVPVELLTIESDLDLAKSIQNAINLLNAKQNVFQFSSLDRNELLIEKFASGYPLSTYKVFSEMEKFRNTIKGYHPNIICVTNRIIKGSGSKILFGDLERTKNDIPVGNGIITTKLAKEYTSNIPIEVYFMYQSIVGGIQFMIRKKPYHDNPVNCIYDNKKTESARENFINTLKECRICVDCQSLIRKQINEEQLKSIKEILDLISNISFSDVPSDRLNQELETISIRLNGIDIGNLKEKVGMDKLNEVFKELLSYAKEKKTKCLNIENDIYSLNAQFTSIKREQNLGTISAAEMSLRRNQIIFGILEIIERLKSLTPQ